MALPASGTMTADMIRNEFAGSNPFSISQYYRGGGRVPNSAANGNIPTGGTISFSNFYGASNIDQVPDPINFGNMYSSFNSVRGSSPTPNWSFSSWYTVSGIDVPISVGFAATDIVGGSTDLSGGCAFLATDVELMRGGTSIPGRFSAIYSAEDSFTYSAGSPLTLQNGDQIRLKLMVGGRLADVFEELGKDKGYIFQLINNTDGGSVIGTCNSWGSYTGRGYDNCAWTGAYLPSGVQVKDAQVGDALLLLNDDGNGYYNYDVTKISFSYANCWTIVTSSGIELTVSDTTPIIVKETLNGEHYGVTFNQGIVGLYVPVLDEGEFRWEPIVRLINSGELPVGLISADNGVYAAGNKPGRHIFTHNIQMKQDPR